MKHSSNAVTPYCAEKREELVLGLVVLPHPGRLPEMIGSLAAFPDIELGATENHRVPAVAHIRVGQDEALLEAVRTLPAVMHANIVFAQIISEDSTNHCRTSLNASPTRTVVFDSMTCPSVGTCI